MRSTSMLPILVATLLLPLAGIATPCVAQVAPADAPAVLTLEQAYDAARENHPQSGEQTLLARKYDLERESLRRKNFPNLGVFGQAIYHSEVASFPAGTPGLAFPSVPHDQYKIGLEITGPIYDGGAIATLREITSAETNVRSEEVDVSIYGQRSLIENAYFGALSAAAGAASLARLKEDLAARRSQAESLARGGVLLRSDIDVLDAELARLEQQIGAVKAQRLGALDVLSELTGIPLNDEVELTPGRASRGESTSRRAANSDSENGRPEWRVFDATQDLLEISKKRTRVAQRPRVMGFLEGAAGRPPGLNLFEDEFQPYFTAGVRLAWNPWAWGTPDRDRQVIEIQREIVETQRAKFDQGVRTAAAGLRREIDRLESAIETDAAIVELRGRIARRAESEFENGVATATDYLVEKNAETRARLDADLHMIQLTQARARLRTVLGVDPIVPGNSAR